MSEHNNNQACDRKKSAKLRIKQVKSGSVTDGREILRLPVIPLRGIVSYPRLTLSFDVGRMSTLASIKRAMKDDRRVFLVAQKEVGVEDPQAGDLYRVGVVAEIRQILEVSDNHFKVLTEGLFRGRIKRLNKQKSGDFYVAQIEPFDRPDPQLLRREMDELQFKAARRELLSLFESYAMETFLVPPDVVAYAKTIRHEHRLMDLISAHIDFELEKKQALLEEQDLWRRIEMLLIYLTEELKMAEYSAELNQKVQSAIDKQQRDYFLREQMKTIEDELHQREGEMAETDRLRDKLKKSNIPAAYKEKLEREITRLSRMPASFPEASVQQNWLEMVINLPFGRMDEEKLDLAQSRLILERDHYGMKRVKDRVLEYLAVRKLQSEQGDTRVKGPILCFVGPPGVGKTSIARSIAEALGRRYIRMSLGGIRDEAEIRGHRRTYIGAMAGRIMQGIRHVDTDNPLFLLDEIDKLGRDFTGDPSSALLEVLDPEQNNSFRDHYVEVPYDLSHVLFITTANSLDYIPGALLDRMEVIHLSGYTEEDKIEIASRHLLPKQIEANGLTPEQISLTRGALSRLISWYTAEAGVRQLERELARLCRRVAIKIAEGSAESVRVKQNDLENLLGRKKYRFDMAEKEDRIGCVTGLAWTYAGGDTLTIEVNLLPGSGKLELTGHLGDIMKESAKAALTYCRSRSDQLGVKDDFSQKYDVHIHVPAGAVPKDGPSAGITLATALASALSEKKVRHDLAMTGEISLRGHVLPIGGLTEKLVAANRAGIKEVLIPKENETDLEEVPDTIKKKLKITPVGTMDEVLSIALKDFQFPAK